MWGKWILPHQGKENLESGGYYRERVMSGNGYRLSTNFKVLFLKAEYNFLLVDVP